MSLRSPCLEAWRSHVWGARQPEMQALTSITQVENLSLLGWKGPGGILKIPPPTAFWHA